MYLRRLFRAVRLQLGCVSPSLLTEITEHASHLDEHLLRRCLTTVTSLVPEFGQQVYLFASL